MVRDPCPACPPPASFGVCGDDPATFTDTFFSKLDKSDGIADMLLLSSGGSCGAWGAGVLDGYERGFNAASQVGSSEGWQAGLPMRATIEPADQCIPPFP